MNGVLLAVRRPESHRGRPSCRARRQARSIELRMTLARQGWGLNTMPRFQTDDDFYDDPAVAQAGTAAVGLYYRCGIYVARKLLDGFVPDSTSAQYGTPEWIRRLTDAGLWETVPGGHYMPLYFPHGNPTRAKVLADRDAKAQRQLRWLEKQRNASSGQRRVSRRSSSASDGTSEDGSADAALPPSLKGRKATRARETGARAAHQSPLLGAVEDRHEFEPDHPGSTSCAQCGLAQRNKRHLEAS